MRFLTEVLVCWIAGGVLLLPGTGRSDCCPPNMTIVGGAPAPQSPLPSIRMDSQEVTIRLKHLGYSVQAVYQFFNTGEKITERVGFPKHVVKWSPSIGPCPDPHHRVDDFMRFHASVNGRQVVCSEERDFLTGSDSSWMVTEVTFPANGKTSMTVTYDAHYYIEDYRVSYVYGTGPYWSRNAGKAAFIIDSADLLDRKNISVRFPSTPTRAIAESVLRIETGHLDTSPRDKLVVSRTRKRN